MAKTLKPVITQKLAGFYCNYNLAEKIHGCFVSPRNIGNFQSSYYQKGKMALVSAITICRQQIQNTLLTPGHVPVVIVIIPYVWRGGCVVGGDAIVEYLPRFLQVANSYGGTELDGVCDIQGTYNPDIEDHIGFGILLLTEDGYVIATEDGHEVLLEIPVADFLTEDRNFHFICENGTILVQEDFIAIQDAARGTVGSIVVAPEVSGQTCVYNVESTGGVEISKGFEIVFSQPMAGEDLTGALGGVATYNTEGGYIELTPATNSCHGSIEYSTDILEGATNWIAQFDIFAGGGSGADALWLYAYCLSTPVTEGGSNGGYQVYFGEYSNSIGVNTFGSVPFTTTFNNLDDSTWRTVVVKYNNQNFSISVDGILQGTYFDDNVRDLSSTKIGLGGRCGAVNNIHRVRNLIIQIET